MPSPVAQQWDAIFSRGERRRYVPGINNAATESGNSLALTDKWVRNSVNQTIAAMWKAG
jgi:hypothetical protein